MISALKRLGLLFTIFVVQVVLLVRRLNDAISWDMIKPPSAAYRDGSLDSITSSRLADYGVQQYFVVPVKAEDEDEENETDLDPESEVLQKWVRDFDFKLDDNLMAISLPPLLTLVGLTEENAEIIAKELLANEVDTLAALSNVEWADFPNLHVSEQDQQLIARISGTIEDAVHKMHDGSQGHWMEAQDVPLWLRKEFCEKERMKLFSHNRCLVSPNDVGPALCGLKVELFWPETNEWYVAEIQSMSVEGGCSVLYEKGEQETISAADLSQLVNSGGMAFHGGKRPRLSRNSDRNGRRPNRGLARIPRKLLEDMLAKQSGQDMTRIQCKKSKLIRMLEGSGQEQVADAAGMSVSELLEAVAHEEEEEDAKETEKKLKQRGRPRNWTSKCKAILHSIRSAEAEGEDARLLSETLYRLPSRKQLPEYVPLVLTLGLLRYVLGRSISRTGTIGPSNAQSTSRALSMHLIDHLSEVCKANGAQHGVLQCCCKDLVQGLLRLIAS